ncbi:MAG: heavy-metal-associated domain-containing protein [gamma proteobacterium symbiont of Taylorina sp.]|nr:heavy-metal-associated domain-containing protein [gamma proteobacterium symbiont of Taylorina sp.]
MTGEQQESYKIHIIDMTCDHCVTRVKKTALAVNQVKSISINLGT